MSAEGNSKFSSPYTTRPFEERAEMPVYNRAAELVRKYSSNKNILDLGSSDFIAASALANEGYSFTGMDQDITSLQSGRDRFPSFPVIQAKLPDFPLGASLTFDTVLLLDVLEHLSRDGATILLAELKRTLPEHFSIIISMPIVSPTSLATWNEAARVVKNKGKRPDTGLFDKTHKILTGRKGHEDLFDESGYHVVEEDLIQWHPNLPLNSFRLRVFNALSRRIIPTLINPSGSDQKTTRDLTAYQGLYVIQPK